MLLQELHEKAKKYANEGNYTNAYYWALESLASQKEIDALMLISAQSLAKDGKHILLNYIHLVSFMDRYYFLDLEDYSPIKTIRDPEGTYFSKDELTNEIYESIVKNGFYKPSKVLSAALDMPNDELKTYINICEDILNKKELSVDYFSPKPAFKGNVNDFISVCTNVIRVKLEAQSMDDAMDDGIKNDGSTWGKTFDGLTGEQRNHCWVGGHHTINMKPTREQKIHSLMITCANLEMSAGRQDSALLIAKEENFTEQEMEQLDDIKKRKEAGKAPLV